MRGLTRWARGAHSSRDRVARCLAGIAVLVALYAGATTAFADDKIQNDPFPSSPREIQAAVQSYLQQSPCAAPVESLLGADAGFFHLGFMTAGPQAGLTIGTTIQTRFEAFRWRDGSAEPSPGGDLSGFSLPRATLRLDGTLGCAWAHASLEFGHPGSLADNEVNQISFAEELAFGFQPGATRDRIDYGIVREAWLERSLCRSVALRAGLFPTPATRQLMTSPAEQQFADISLASTAVGTFLPGYSDRNRDYGVAAHGALGRRDEWSYLVTLTNGDGPPRRNVFDGLTDDNFAYGARVDWRPLGYVGWGEGARSDRCPGLDVAVGAWANAYHDVNFDRPHTLLARRSAGGLDALARRGGWSFTGAYSAIHFEGSGGLTSTDNLDVQAWLLQAGYRFRDSPLEVAARLDGYSVDPNSTARFGAIEFGVAGIFHIDGNRAKVTIDAALLHPEDDGNFQADVYAGYSVTGTSDALLLRLQWQLDF